MTPPAPEETQPLPPALPDSLRQKLVEQTAKTREDMERFRESAASVRTVGGQEIPLPDALGRQFDRKLDALRREIESDTDRAIEAAKRELDPWDTTMPLGKKKILADEEDLENDHSWHFDQTSDTGGDITLGLVFIGGVSVTVGSFTASISSVTTSRWYWIAVNISSATATWTSGAALASSTDTVEIWPILEITCAASKITNVVEHMQSDIHITKLM
jgi:hypothetical protein